jgi:hypothetical protein
MAGFPRQTLARQVAQSQAVRSLGKKGVNEIPVHERTPAEHRRLDRRIKKRYEKLRRRYPEVHDIFLDPLACKPRLAKHGLKPQRLDRYMATNDPDFEQKAADIIGLYLNPPAHAAVFCVDEKKASSRAEHRFPRCSASLTAFLRTSKSRSTARPWVFPGNAT